MRQSAIQIVESYSRFGASTSAQRQQEHQRQNSLSTLLTYEMGAPPRGPRHVPLPWFPFAQVFAFFRSSRSSYQFNTFPAPSFLFPSLVDTAFFFFWSFHRSLIDLSTPTILGRPTFSRP